MILPQPLDHTCRVTKKYSERLIITLDGEPAAMAAGDNLVFTHSDDTTVKTFVDLINSANGSAAYTYMQYDFRGLNAGSDSLSVKGNFTFCDSDWAQGGLGNCGYSSVTVDEEPTTGANRKQ